MDRLDQIRSRLREMRDAYYNLSPIGSDAEFDALKAELSEQCPTDEEVVAIGAPVSAHTVWDKVRHEIPMGSLDKVNSADGFLEWSSKTPAHSYCLTHKIDGSSMELVYSGGKLVRCVTRGDGVVGEDVTVNVSKIPSVPRTIPGGVNLTVRGEVVMAKDIFAEKYASEYANPRNTAAGKVRDKRGGGEDCKNLDFRAYWSSPHEDRPHTMFFLFHWLESLGFSVPTEIAAGQVDHMVARFEEARSGRGSVPYEIDGMVVSVNDLSLLDGLGDSNMRPIGQIAWKFDAESRETRVVDVRWQIGPTGRVTPVASVEPVSIGGVTITSVSLHNMGIFEELALFPGCRVLVARRNDVIPYIEANLDHGSGNLFQAPSLCPVCSGPLVSNGDFFLRCPAKPCPAKLSGSVKVWVARLGLLHWGDALVDALTDPDAPVVSSVADLYRLTAEDLATCCSGAKMARKCLDTLRSNRSVKLELVLSALNIPNFGLSTASDIVAAGHDTVEKVLALSEEDLLAVPNVGAITAAQVAVGLAERADVLRDLAGVLDIVGPISGPLSDISFCITGTTAVPRKTLQKRILDAGGIVKDSVGAGLSYLVTNETTMTSKRKAAEKHSIPVISEDRLCSMMTRPPAH